MLVKDPKIKSQGKFLHISSTFIEKIQLFMFIYIDYKHYFIYIIFYKFKILIVIY